MALDLEKYVELSKKKDITQNDIKYLVFGASEAIKDDFDTKQAMAIVWNVISSFSLVSDEEIIDRLLDITHAIASQVTTDVEKTDCDYMLLIIHLRLGYAPKAVEYALKLISSENANALQRYVAYTELTNRALNCGEYEKGREFALRGIGLISQLDEKVRDLYSVIIYGNYLCILANLNNKQEFEETQAVINRIIDENPDNPDIKVLSVSIQIDLVAANIMSKGCSQKRVLDYAKYFNKFVCKAVASKEYYHDINSDVTALNKLFEEGYHKECAQICSKIIDTPSCFSGHIDEIYSLIEKLHDADNTLFAEDVYSSYLTRYLKAMQKTEARNTAMMKRMVSEEFRIFDINSEYESIRVKYETDSLTVCFNRPSFEMNAAPFMQDNPGGSLVFFDIDGLKYTNDHFGHNSGDYMLKTFATEINKILDTGRDRLYRYAGDEFILLTSRNRVETANLIRRIIRRFEKPFKFNKIDLYVTFSYGIASFSESVAKEDEDPINSVVRLADKHMYECKKLHKKKAPNKVRL